MTLREWIHSFEGQFVESELGTPVVFGDIKLRLDAGDGSVHFHRLEFVGKPKVDLPQVDLCLK